MLPSTPKLQTHELAIQSLVVSHLNPCEGVEAALFHARSALEAGWRLTPEEALAYVGSYRPSYSKSSGSHSHLTEAEDEAEDIALFFSEP